MTKLNREVHHFSVLETGLLATFAPVIKEILLERGQSLADKVVILKSLPWEELRRDFSLANMERFREILRDYLRILLEKDPWVVKNLIR